MTRILAIDQGTTSTRAVVFNDQAEPVASAQIELQQYFPQPGWVEHDPIEIANAAISVSKQAVERAGVTWRDIDAIGITNQRETTLIWERETGRPLANAIVWQCRRTAELCESYRRAGHSNDIQSATGLVIDPYFSATKLRWLLDSVPDAQARAEDGEICFGTVDSWLIYRLTGGQAHATDCTNASRTMLLNIHDLEWDPDLLSLFDVPEAMLPEVMPSAGHIAATDGSVLGGEVPITGVAGDQHAALYGQACFDNGMAKCTYGTGAFILANAGSRAGTPDFGLLSTLGWQIGARRTYALEGSIFVTGATVQWLRDGLGMISDAAESELLAEQAEENDGVYLVPAFVGLGAPHWDASARASITGMTRGTDKRHIARAALESTAYQVRDVVDAMEQGKRRNSERPLRADGGQSSNGFLMQFQADILDRPVEVSAVSETTAQGVAFLAGRGAGIWSSENEIEGLWRASATYEPQMSAGRRNTLYAGWLDAVRRVRTNI